MSTLERILRFSKNYNKVGVNKHLDTIRIVAADNGACTAEYKVEERHTNSEGGLHSGFIATVVDTISAYGLRAYLGHHLHVTLKINMSFVKIPKVHDEIIIKTRPLKIGKTVSVLLVVLRDKNTGELLVKGTHTMWATDHVIPDELIK